MKEGRSAPVTSGLVVVQSGGGAEDLKRNCLAMKRRKQRRYLKLKADRRRKETMKRSLGLHATELSTQASFCEAPDVDQSKITRCTRAAVSLEFAGVTYV